MLFNCGNNTFAKALSSNITRRQIHIGILKHTKLSHMLIWL